MTAPQLVFFLVLAASCPCRLVDLDGNGWPQLPRNRALAAIRRAWTVHLCGDQHLAVVVKHGIVADGNGPYGFTSPALVNAIYGRWQRPADERPGPNPVAGSPLPWTEDFHDGLGNKIRMLAYANPANIADEKQRADGYGGVRFHKPNRTITLECWPRFSSAGQGDSAPFPGWPTTIAMDANDGRAVVGWLPELVVEGVKNFVVQVIQESSGEILYTIRTQAKRFQPRVYAAGKYTVKFARDKIGMDHPDAQALTGLEAQSRNAAGVRTLQL